MEENKDDPVILFWIRNKVKKSSGSEGIEYIPGHYLGSVFKFVREILIDVSNSYTL